VNEKQENVLPAKVNYRNFQGNSIQYSVNCGESELNVVMIGKHDPEMSYEFILLPAEKLIIETGK